MSWLTYRSLAGTLPVATLTSLFAQTPSVSDWRKKPVPLVHDALGNTGTVTKYRDSLFDTLTGSGTPLDEQQPENTTHSMLIRERPEQKELPVDTSNTIVAATFDSYSVHLTSTKRSVYTALAFTISEVYRSGPQNLRVGNTATILKSGGSGRAANGHLISIGLYDDTDHFAPGNKYMLFLSYDPSSDSYSVNESWLLKNGVAIPNSPDDISRASAGQLEHKGSTDSQLIVDLKHKLAPANEAQHP